MIDDFTKFILIVALVIASTQAQRCFEIGVCSGTLIGATTGTSSDNLNLVFNLMPDLFIKRNLPTHVWMCARIPQTAGGFPMTSQMTSVDCLLTVQIWI